MDEYRTQKPLKRIILKEELVELTGDPLAAIILNQLIYWSERVKDHDKMLKEEYERLEDEGINIDKNIEFRSGWIYKSAEVLNEEIMMRKSEPTIRRRLNDLVDNGWLQRRRNPKYKQDRTFQYRVDIINIQKDLLEIGYNLDKYPSIAKEVYNAWYECNKNSDELKESYDYSNQKSSVYKKKYDESTINADETLPESTKETNSKITTENITDNSNTNSAFSNLELKSIKDFYQKVTERKLKSHLLEEITSITDNVDKIMEAIKRASLNNTTTDTPSAQYILSILKNLEDEQNEDYKYDNEADKLEDQGWT